MKLIARCDEVVNGRDVIDGIGNDTLNLVDQSKGAILAVLQRLQGPARRVKFDENAADKFRQNKTAFSILRLSDAKARCRFQRGPYNLRDDVEMPLICPTD